ncbi:MAG: SDR family NAD(P)-dependent oxidoreductase [Planctomycetota bacterium]|nr:SDR family NAD(P)-dependent oxidoreductase [Planctomycetota bacterium]
MLNENERPVAIVTGAGSGIGRAISLRLAAAGHRLVLIGRTMSRLEETQGLLESQALVISADLGKSDQPARIVEATLEAVGRVDVLINNAASGPYKPIEETTDTDLHDTFEVDLFGPMRLVTKLWPHFTAQGSGCVVNISSMAAASPFPGLSVYAAAKSGLESLTRSIFNEGDQLGIRAYSIAPGAVETDMLRGILSKDQLPTENTLDPDDVAKVVVECVHGEREADRGKTILMPSP